ncbi:MAG TPA: L-lysine 6-transaminase [Thermoanaerobaculia bacterium]|jgi:L-lysine 6-transaminase|nr:L-lysine 6-transaminase [Thermoanaerobaculia bacterium]
MSIATATSLRVAPSEVHETLKRHMLADGFGVVLDLERSHGCWLYDSRRERELLDFFTSFSSYPMGFNHPKLLTPEMRERLLRAAVVKPSNADLYTPYFAEFVATFARTVPEAFRRHLFFVDGGALAVENCLKTAFDWKVRKNLQAGRGEKGYQVIHFRQAFHGRSGYTLSLTNTADPRKIQYYPKFDWPRILNPKLSFPVTEEVLARVAAEERQALDAIRQVLATQGDDVACIILEPIQAEGGDNHFRPEFLRALRQVADENEVLLVFDEVQTGFATTGRWWCFEHFDVQPDLFAFGKKTQQCGMASSGRIDDVDSVFKISSRINSTWGGNLVDMVRCQRFVEIIEEDDLIANAETMGRHLLAGLQALEQAFPGQVTSARGRGLFAAFDLPSTELRNATLKAMSEHDLMALPCGERSIRFRPPLVVGREEVDEGLRRSERALGNVLGAP